MGTGAGGVSSGSNTTSSGDFGTNSSAGGVPATNGGTTSNSDGGISNPDGGINNPDGGVGTPPSANQLGADISNAGTAFAGVSTGLGIAGGALIGDILGGGEAGSLGGPGGALIGALIGAGVGVAGTIGINNYGANQLDQMQNPDAGPPDAGPPDAGPTPAQTAALNQLDQAEITGISEEQQLQNIVSEAEAGDTAGAQAQGQALAPQVQSNVEVELQDVSELAGANSVLGQAANEAAMKAALPPEVTNPSGGGGGDSGGDGDSGGGN